MKKQLNCAVPPNVVKDVLKLIASYGGVRKAALGLGLSPTYISKVVRGETAPSIRVAEMTGWKRCVTWKKEKVNA